MKKDKNQILREALFRRAIGYEATETVEEYTECDGEIKLLKRRVSTKNVPPDVTAVKMIMDEDTLDLTEMTDEQLTAEKQRLLKLLKEESENAKNK